MFYCQWVKKASKQNESVCVCMWICTVHFAWIAREVFTSINTYRPQLMLNFLSLVLSARTVLLNRTFYPGIPHRKKAFTKRFPSYDEIIYPYMFRCTWKLWNDSAGSEKKPNCIHRFGERRNSSHRWEGWTRSQHMSREVGDVCLFVLFCLVPFIR